MRPVIAAAALLPDHPAHANRCLVLFVFLLGAGDRLLERRDGNRMFRLPGLLAEWPVDRWYRIGDLGHAADAGGRHRRLGRGLAHPPLAGLVRLMGTSKMPSLEHVFTKPRERGSRPGLPARAFAAMQLTPVLHGNFGFSELP